MSSFLQCPILHTAPAIRHAFFTRNLPGSTHGYILKNTLTPEEALKNRTLAMERIGANGNDLCLVKQEHTNVALAVDRAFPATIIPPVADAMVTNIPGLVLGVLTADCTPILFADREARVIGAAHAGWRGAKSGVIESTLEQMERLGASISRVIAAIGPCIQQHSYEVGSEFYDNFLQDAPDNNLFFIPSVVDGRFMFNMPAYVSMRLKAAGVGHITNLHRDTCSDEEHFFSYRRCCLKGTTYSENGLSVIGLL